MTLRIWCRNFIKIESNDLFDCVGLHKITVQYCSYVCTIFNEYEVMNACRITYVVYIIQFNS